MTTINLTPELLTAENFNQFGDVLSIENKDSITINDGFANKKANERKLYIKVLPKRLDEEVASLMVRGFGGTLTKLTKQQQDYISVSEDGPFKDDSYTY